MTSAAFTVVLELSGAFFIHFCVVKIENIFRNEGMHMLYLFALNPTDRQGGYLDNSGLIYDICFYVCGFFYKPCFFVQKVSREQILAMEVSNRWFLLFVWLFVWWLSLWSRNVNCPFMYGLSHIPPQ